MLRSASVPRWATRFWPSEAPSLQPLVLLALVTGTVAILIVPPLVFLVDTSLSVAAGSRERGPLTLLNYWHVLTNAESLPLLLNTVAFSAGSSLVSLFGGSFLAFMVARTNMPWKGLVHVVLILVLAMPGVIYAIGWILLLNQRGILNGWLMGALGLGRPPVSIFSLSGMIMVEGLHWIPLVFFLMLALFAAMDPSLEESAFTSGANQWQTVRKITVRLMVPGLLSLFILNFIRGLEAFEVPALVGIPGRVEVLVSEIFLLTRTTPPDYGVASAFSLLLIGVVAVSLYLYSVATRRAERFQTVRGRGFAPRTLNLGKWRWAAWGGCLMLLFVAAMLPILAILWTSLLPFYQLPSPQALGRVSLANFMSVVQLPSVGQSVRNSLLLAVAAATITMLLTTVAAWLVVRMRARGGWLIDLMIMAPLVFPGIIIGVALLRVFLTVPVPLYGTLGILLIAYVTSFMPYGMRYAHPGVLQIHQELEDSAYISGASWLGSFRRIVLPLVKVAFFGGWLYIFLIAFRELSRSILLYSPGSKVVAVTIFELWQDGQLPEMAAFSVLLMVGLFLFALVSHRLIGRSRLWAA